MKTAQEIFNDLMVSCRNHVKSLTREIFIPTWGSVDPHMDGHGIMQRFINNKLCEEYPVQRVEVSPSVFRLFKVKT